jgi:Spy/CpxP family protein refolding chaperone
MFWVPKVAVPAALVIGLAVGAASLAQPPGGEGPRDRKGPQPDRKGAPGGDEKKGRPFAEKRNGPPPGERGRGPAKADASVEAWVKVLTDKMNDPHDTVRDSARAALLAVGPEAVPALQKLTEGDDSAKAATARKLIGAIAGSQRGPGGPGQPGGFGPMPPQPPGRPGEAGRPNPLDRILAELDLTDKQKQQVEAVRAAHQKKAQEVIEKVRAGQIDRQDVRTAMDKLSEDATKELKDVLTADQGKRLDDLTPAGRPLFPPPFPPGGRAGERPGPDGPPSPRPERG